MSMTSKVPVKSPSQRLRGVFYSLFKQDDQGFDDFDSYYDDKMDKIINHYKKFIKNEEYKIN